MHAALYLLLLYEVIMYCLLYRYRNTSVWIKTYILNAESNHASFDVPTVIVEPRTFRGVKKKIQTGELTSCTMSLLPTWQAKQFFCSFSLCPIYTGKAVWICYRLYVIEGLVLAGTVSGNGVAPIFFSDVKKNKHFYRRIDRRRAN